MIPERILEGCPSLQFQELIEKEVAMPKCCYYERTNGERYTLCTSDENCPTIDGDTLIGSWGVTSCDECRTSESTEAPTDLAAAVTFGKISDLQDLRELLKNSRPAILLIK